MNLEFWINARQKFQSEELIKLCNACYNLHHNLIQIEMNSKRNFLNPKLITETYMYFREIIMILYYLAKEKSEEFVSALGSYNKRGDSVMKDILNIPYEKIPTIPTFMRVFYELLGTAYLFISILLDRMKQHETILAEEIIKIVGTEIVFIEKEKERKTF